MWKFDFLIFYHAGQAVLAGTSPYAVEGFLSPYPLALLFALVAWMPENMAYAIYVAGNLLMMWKLLHKKGIWALLSFPVMFTLFVGQLDLLMGLAAGLFGSWALLFVLVKPQVGFVLVPWLVRHMTRRQLIGVGLTSACILGICFLLRPQWLSEMLAVSPPMADYSLRNSGVYWIVPVGYKDLAIAIGSVIGLVAAFLLKERKHSMIVAHLLSPLTNFYSISFFAEWIGPLEVLISWVIILLIGGIHSGAPYFILGLTMLAFPYVTKWWSEKRDNQATAT